MATACVDELTCVWICSPYYRFLLLPVVGVKNIEMVGAAVLPLSQRRKRESSLYYQPGHTHTWPFLSYTHTHASLHGASPCNSLQEKKSLQIGPQQNNDAPSPFYHGGQFRADINIFKGTGVPVSCSLSPCRWMRCEEMRRYIETCNLLHYKPCERKRKKDRLRLLS